MWILLALLSSPLFVVGQTRVISHGYSKSNFVEAGIEPVIGNLMEIVKAETVIQCSRRFVKAFEFSCVP